MQPSIALFNHVLNQHPALCAALATHAGRRIALSFGPLTFGGVLTADGWLAESEGAPEATIRVSALAAWQAQWSGRAPAFNDLAFTGDMALAQSVGRIMASLRWVASDDLSRLLGDVVAHRVDRGVRSVAGLNGAMAQRLMESVLEHLREESPLLARKQDVEHALKAVDTLRDDCERLEKRLERLEAATLLRWSSRPGRNLTGKQ